MSVIYNYYYYITQNNMQELTHKLVMNIAIRIPSIKFLGPRDQIQFKNEPTPIKTKQADKAVLSGPALKVPFIQSPRLTAFENDVVNSGGFADLSYLKVKPIPLKKK